MKPFTEQEMIRVAKAAGYDNEIIENENCAWLSWIKYVDGKCLQVSTGDDKVMFESFEEGLRSIEFDILAVADTIREILKERGDDNTSN